MWNLPKAAAALVVDSFQLRCKSPAPIGPTQKAINSVREAQESVEQLGDHAQKQNKSNM
jgi:hypothetical protein